MKKKNDKFLLWIAAFDTENNENQILLGEGLTLTEAIVRAIEFDFTDEELRNIIQTYGPDDFVGLHDWYLSRGIYISEPIIIQGKGSIGQ